MLCALGIIKIMPEHHDSVYSEIVNTVENSRNNEEGCIELHLHRDNNDKNTYILYGIWADENAFAIHGESDYVKSFNKHSQGKLIDMQIFQMKKI